MFNFSPCFILICKLKNSYRIGMKLIYDNLFLNYPSTINITDRQQTFYAIFITVTKIGPQEEIHMTRREEECNLISKQ